MKTKLKESGVSRVWAEDGRIYKWQPKYLTDNEVFALRAFEEYGFVPKFQQVDEETISMEMVEEEEITNEKEFRKACLRFMNCMRLEGVRHGDLTRPHILPVNNSPIVIDWGESRMADDPRPDKRREGDWYWIRKTVKESWGISI